MLEILFANDLVLYVLRTDDLLLPTILDLGCSGLALIIAIGGLLENLCRPRPAYE